MISNTVRAEFLFIVILFFVPNAAIIAADGDFDSNFGVGGVVITDNGVIASEYIQDLEVQPDGKIVALGYSTEFNSIQRNVVVRYNSNGSLDTTFGFGGRFVFQSIFATALAVQPNGRIIVVGRIGNFPGGDFYIARLNSDGSFDGSFNGTGELVLDLRGTFDTAASVRLQPDGKILVGGRSARGANNADDYAIVRLFPDGSLDFSFDGDGKVFTVISPQAREVSATELVLQADGKIVAAGGGVINDPAGGFALIDAFVTARYFPDGSLDFSFDGDGLVFTRFADTGTINTATANSVAVQCDGKIVVAGVARTNFSPAIGNAALARYNADGSLDFSFGNGGKSVIQFPFYTDSIAYDVALQADNKVLIGALVSNSSTSNAAAARLDAFGFLDATFNGDGQNVFTASPGNASSTYALAIQPDGKVLIGGGIRLGNTQDFLLVRFEGSVGPSNCFAVGNQKVLDFDGDGRTDLSVFRSGTWLINPSSANNPSSYYGVQFGLATDRLTPEDFDGDGKTDIAVWRENAAGGQGNFYILQSATNSLRFVEFGLAGDDPRMVGDWDGDGLADPAVYRDAAGGGQSVFFYRPSSQPAIDFIPVYWGVAGDEALRGDFDGDGRQDAAVFRPSNSVWYILQSSNNQARYQQWGLATDKRVAGDFDGDARTDLVSFRNGIWYILQSSNNQARYQQWGLNGDHLVAGDYDGDGRTDFAVWRAGVYYILRNLTGQPIYQNFGANGDFPAAAAFVR